MIEDLNPNASEPEELFAQRAVINDILKQSMPIHGKTGSDNTNCRSSKAEIGQKPVTMLSYAGGIRAPVI